MVPFLAFIPHFGPKLHLTMRLIPLCLMSLALFSSATECFSQMNQDRWQQALSVHRDALVADGHVDAPYRIVRDGVDLRERHTSDRLHLDFPRMRDAGLDAAFFALFVAGAEHDSTTALLHDMLAQTLHQIERADGVELARTAADVRRIVDAGHLAILLALEGGHGLNGRIENLQPFAEAGVRYLTLTHIVGNTFSDASQAPPVHGGLSPEGVRLIETLDRLGIVPDLSHVSDEAFFQAVAAAKGPVMLSHSSARALTPGVRNVSDEMLRAVAATGGIVMINFFDMMVNPAITQEVIEEAERRLGPERNWARYWATVAEIRRERGIERTTWESVVDHLHHVAQVAGVDHVGLGSDFDGVSSLPTGLEDVTGLPLITYGLLERGYSETDIRKILGENVLRVLEQAERRAASYESRD